MMTFNLKPDICCCAICGKEFDDGDLLCLRKTSLVCYSCCPDASEPTHIYSCGTGHRLLRSSTMTSLSNGFYIVDETPGFLTIIPSPNRHICDNESLMEIHDGEFSVLLSRKFRRNWVMFFDRFPGRRELKTLKPQQITLVTDSHSQMYGFLSSRAFQSSIFTRTFVKNRNLHFIAQNEIQKRFDLTPYAVKLRRDLCKLDPKELLAYCAQHVQGQGVELQKAVYLVWQYLLSICNGGKINSYNWFLTAPSGCGKTEFYRTLRQYFADRNIPIPVVQVDLSRVTEEGFKGMDPSSIIDMIISECPETSGYGICFLDEADKKLIPCFDGHGSNINKNIQGSLLTLVEGIATKQDKEGKTKEFDSSKTMFVFVGAFQDLRIERQKKNSKKSIGFLNCQYQSENAADNFYDPITMDDIIETGMQDELAGRIQQIINFRRMSDESMLQLLRSKTTEIGTELGCLIELSDQAEQDLLSISYGSLGVRKPLNVIRELTLKAISEYFFTEEFAIEDAVVRIDNLENASITNAIDTWEDNDLDEDLLLELDTHDCLYLGNIEK